MHTIINTLNIIHKSDVFVEKVHFQNSAELMKSLTDAEIPFQVQIYPDTHHRRFDRNTTRHFYRTMTTFLQNECWGGVKPHDAKIVVVETNQKQKQGKT